jgi:soluble lytic murein transglycosylase-like protein
MLQKLINKRVNFKACVLFNPCFKMLVVICLFYSNLSFASQEREQLSPDIALTMHSSIVNPITPHLVFKDNVTANAWLNDMSSRIKNWVPDEFIRKKILTVIQYESSRAGLDTQLVLSLITVESRFNKYAISSTGARGVMQVMPFWVAQIGDANQDLFDFETNIRYGCTILRYYLIKEHGNMRRALARYNGSLGRDDYPNLIYAAYNKYWRPASVIMINKNKVNYIDYSDN